MAFPTTPILDDFNRADQALSASANWTDGIEDSSGALGSLEIVSNSVRAADADTRCSAYWSAESFDAPCEVYGTLSGKQREWWRLWACIQSPNVNNQTCGYEIEFDYSSSTDTIHVWRMDNDVNTLLDDIDQELSAGDSIGLEVKDGTLTVHYKPAAGNWTSIGSVEDSTYTSGYIGMSIESPSGDTLTVDNFGGGAVATNASLTAVAAEVAVAAPAPTVTATVVDTTAPNTTITSGPSDPTTETGGTFALSADETDCTFEVQLDGGSWEAASGSPSNGSGVTTCSHVVSGLSVGEHTLKARATDASDNTDATPAEWAWTISTPPDTTAPNTSITDSPSSTTTHTKATFTLSADETDCTFEVNLDSNGWTPASGTPANGSGVTTCSHVETDLSVGEHTLQARATDAADNTDSTPASVTWTIEEKPAVTIGPERFGEAMAQSHTPIVRATVLPDGVELPILDGLVTLDITSPSLASMDLTIADDGTLAPTKPTDLLAPYGREVLIEMGVRYPEGVEETVPVATCRIEDADVDDDGGLGLTISGRDRSSRVIEATLEDPWSITSGTNAATAILALLQAVWDVPYDEAEFNSVTTTLPALSAAEGDDRWELCQGLAEAAGRRLYFDPQGVLRIPPVTERLTPTLTISEGNGGVLLGVQRRWNRDGTFNRVVVTGENLGNATSARGVATDDDPNSPTYYSGVSLATGVAFGHVPRFYSSDYIASDSQAQHVADTILAKERGTSQSLSFDSLIDPRLRPDDVVLVRRQRLGVDEAHVIDQLTIPLTGGRMSAQTRAVRVS